MSKASEDLTSTEKTLAADEKYLEELRQSCSTKAAEWEQRQKDAAEEMGAIEKAKEILSEGVTAMMQTATPEDFDSGEDDAQSEAEQRVRERVETLLKDVGQKVHSYAMVSVVSA